MAQYVDGFSPVNRRIFSRSYMLWQRQLIKPVAIWKKRRGRRKS